MKRIPYEMKKKMLILMLREEAIPLKDLPRKAYFVSGRNKQQSARAYVNSMEELTCDSDGIVKFDMPSCPSWVGYVLHIKHNGPATASDLMEKFNHSYSRVYNEIHRQSDITNTIRLDGKIHYEINPQAGIR